MIRFACPGPNCGAIYTVEDAKGGKTGKCPKCLSQFVIPMPEGGTRVEPAAVPAPPPLPPAPISSIPQPPPMPPAVVPVPPPAANPNAPVEVAPCPGCQSRLTVMPGDVGRDVECPSCRTVFTAMLPGTVAPPLPPPIPPSQSKFEKVGRRERDDDEDEDRRPSRRRRDDDDDEDDDRRDRRRNRRDEDDDEDDRRRSRRDEDDEDRPRKKKKKRYREESKRLVAGLLAILVGGFGVHKFYLGYNGAGVLMIVLSCFGIGGIIALVEGIIYLTKTDDEFIEIYQRGTKEWF